jgi:ankyrin repeat protein
MCTPLVASLVQGHDAVADFLLEHGASPHLRSDFDGLTPLEAARKHGRDVLVQRLLQLGAKDAAPSLWRRWLGV